MQSMRASEEPEEIDSKKQKMNTTTGPEEPDSKKQKMNTTTMSEESESQKQKMNTTTVPEESGSKKQKMNTTTVSEEFESQTQNMNTTTASEEPDVNFKFYSPRSIFVDDGTAPEEMVGNTNFDLALSFYHSRYDNENELKVLNRANNYERNAGAAQLYKRDGKTKYTIRGKEDKEYNIVSYGNKEFKTFTKWEFGNKRSSYGHSERILMANILDDLIIANKDSGELQHPSAYSSEPEGSCQQRYEVLKSLKTKASQYKRYLEEKGFIVKMWSERPVCQEDGVGGSCFAFMNSICPKGSQFGYIVKDYTREDNLGDKVEKTSKEFREAYIKYTVVEHKKV